MKKNPVETWYEIEEWIPPENARANIPYWTPVCERISTNAIRPWREKDAKRAREKFKTLANEERKFRLVLVRREVIAEKE